MPIFLFLYSQNCITHLFNMNNYINSSIALKKLIINKNYIGNGKKM